MPVLLPSVRLRTTRHPNPRVLKSGTSLRDFNSACRCILSRIEAVTTAAVFPPWPWSGENLAVKQFALPTSWLRESPLVHG
jgi:hypothetical protein